MRNIFLLIFVLGLQSVEAQQKPILGQGRHLLDPAAYHITRTGLSNSYNKFTREKKGRVAFMGGSITEHGAWRTMVCSYLQEKFPDTQFEFINAGISSTGSTPGAFRLSKDVLSKGAIDLFFEEAAVNDPTNGFGPTAQLRGMEGIVRHALKSNPMMDIVLLHFVDPPKMQEYNSGKTPEVIVQHEKVAQWYNVNSIDLSKEVTDRINAGEFNWKDDFKDLHPSPFGHQVYYRSISAFLDKAYSAAADALDEQGEKRKRKRAKDSNKRKLPKAMDPFSYASGSYYPVSRATVIQGWEHLEQWMPNDGVATRPQYVNLPALVSSQPGAEIRLQFSGTVIGLCIASGPDAGTIEYSVDGKPFKRADLFTQWSASLHLPWYIVLEDGLKNKHHSLVLRIGQEKNERSKGHACRMLHFLVNTP